MVAVHYEPPKPRPMVRPAYLNFVPSPAAVSFNFALASYQADELEHQSTGESLHTNLPLLIPALLSPCRDTPPWLLAHSQY